MNSKELIAHLGIDDRQLRRLLRLGLPCTKDKNRRHFDLDDVDAWLLANGYAAVEHVERICTTYAELAEALGMAGKNPTRTIADWATRPDFPGRPGTRGRADAYLPLDKIRDWIASRDSAVAITEDDDELRKLEKQRRRLQLELAQHDLQLQLGRLADVDEIAAFNRKVIADTVSMLQPIPDEIVALLPAKTPAATRAEIHRQVTQLIDAALESIARLTEGDTDLEDEEAAAATKPPKPKKCKRK